MDEAAIARSVDAWERMRPFFWRRVPCQQFRSDMIRYADVLHELRPPWVLECGTADGGTALFLADMAESAGIRHVFTVDNDPRPLSIDHPRLTILKGDAASTETVARVFPVAAERGLILLDDDHSAGHVLAELDLWAPLADYMIVQDTLMGWLPQYPDNPRQAVEKWLPEHPEFTQDPEPDPTNHPGGWLRRTTRLCMHPRTSSARPHSTPPRSPARRSSRPGR